MVSCEVAELPQARWWADVPSIAFGACLFCLSFSTTLFALALFRLVSFFVMPSLFFDLLFIGFPLGAFVGARWCKPRLKSLIGSLWLLQINMVCSVVLCLFAKNFDYLRAHLFDVELPKLLGQLGVFALMFLPYFTGYGLSEYLGYQVGTKVLGGKVRLVYALYLFGAAAAYLFLKAFLPGLGMARMLAITLAGVAVAVFILNGGKGRKRAGLELATIIAFLFAPGLEPAFLSLFKGKGIGSTWDFQTHLHCRPAFQQWGKYSLVEILSSPNRAEFHGFYNDLYQWSYAPEYGFRNRTLGIVPILESPDDAKLAIVGSGGGRQVRLAVRHGRKKIVAIEIEPAVFEAVRKPEHLLDDFAQVYESPGVVPLCREARSYFEQTSDRFDLIYLPSVGGYPQMMIEPGNMIRTFEAYRTMRDHLTDRGCLAIWYPIGLDANGLLTNEYVRSLRALHMKTEAFRNEQEFLILAYRRSDAKIPSQTDLMQRLFHRPREEMRADPDGFRRNIPFPYPVSDDPHFQPITDDRPFLAGNVRHILSTEQVWKLLGVLGGVWALLGSAAVLGLSRSGNPRIPHRSFASVAALSFLIGFNFLVMEHVLVLSLFKKLYVYGDSLTLGAVGFLVLSGLGSMLSAPRLRRWLTGLAFIALVLMLALGDRLPGAGIFALAAPVAIATGTFFPALFERSSRNPLAVFALDAVGAGAGALASTFVPILSGFHSFFLLGAGLFALTALVNAWFHSDADPKV